ncbi:uncharacterized protein LOC133203486 [Saccostrea echinata]|uniref:uncharacterized protein LOC133203486 n=1 Tax=Saccostrea echinata TaxID=191078 RepID=UPI002A7F09D5|nr:uncharacterized protein LOC133203486 [Saccostrea echinata]
MEGEEQKNALTSIEAFMEFYSRVPRPNMIFSVIGDSDKLIPKQWPKSRFQQSLIYAAKAAGDCWILSKGEPLTVSKILREMMEEYIYLEKPVRKDIRLISIPSKPVTDTGLYFDLPEVLENDWDQYRKRKTLTSETRWDDSFYVDLFIPSVGEDYLEFRFELERTLERPAEKEKNALVFILVEGDLSAVDHVKQATENGIPVMFVKGTGGLADLLSISMELLNEKKALELRTMLPTLFGIELENTEIDELDQSLRTILRRSYLLDAFDVFGKTEEQFAASVGELVQKSWFLENISPTEDERYRESKQARGKTNKEQYRISSYAMEEKWKRETITWHMAKQEYETLGFTSFSSPFSLPLDFFFRFSKFLELKRENPSSMEVMNEAQNLLKTALLTNRTDYIEALLDLNLPFSSDEICEQDGNHISDLYKFSLYDYTERSNSSGMRWVLKEMGGKKKLAKHLFEGEKDCHKIAQKMCKRLLKYNETEDPRLYTYCRTQRRKQYLNRQRYLQAVLLWSLLTHRPDIATMVWRRVANQFYTGLVSAIILQEMSSIATLKDEELAMKLTEHSKAFINRALNMMDNLYRTDRDLAFEILDELDTVWTIQARPLSFAYESKMYDIIAHPCSVGLMDKIWYNGLIPSGMSIRFCKDFLVSSCSCLFRVPTQNNNEQPRVAGSAPCFHFVLHYVSFAVIILLYSYMLLTNLKEYTEMSLFFQMSENVLYIWTGFDFLNDIVSVMGVLWKRTETRRKCRYRFLSRLNDMWKLLGLFCALLVVLTITSRHSLDINFIMPRFAPRSAALLLLFSYLRYMRLFVIHHYTGITFVFLKHMLLNLARFLITIAFFVLGVGIFFEALLVPDNPDLFPGEWYEWRIWRIIYFPYYQYFGETFEETIGIQVENEKVDWSVKGIAAIHMMVGNLLIVNLIIALFTTTYEKILKKSRLVWQFERYHVIEDFRHRTFCNLDYIIPVRGILYLCKKRRKEFNVQVHLKRNREGQILQYIMAGRSSENF